MEYKNSFIPEKAKEISIPVMLGNRLSKTFKLLPTQQNPMETGQSSKFISLKRNSAHFTILQGLTSKEDVKSGYQTMKIQSYRETPRAQSMLISGEGSD